MKLNTSRQQTEDDVTRDDGRSVTAKLRRTVNGKTIDTCGEVEICANCLYTQRKAIFNEYNYERSKD